jgi:cellulose synthase/poly-beta-1,6-N-acetylglucosamine synthase-like glycosyltransferase
VTLALVLIFWLSLGALAWTHLLYPLVAALAARLRPRGVCRGDALPAVSLIVAAHNEENVIEHKLENLLALDYPVDKLEIVVASDASTDRTDHLVERYADRGVRLVRCERGGKVAAQDRGVRETLGEIVAFSDANSMWEPDALRLLVRNLADPDVAYVCGKLAYESSDGTNREGVYWRYELWLRASESRLYSITGGNGAIYAVRREEYVGDDPRYGHDLGFPYLMVQHGKRAIFEPAAVASERTAEHVGDEFGRKVRMFAQCWGHVLTGRMLRPMPPLYYFEIVSHRLLRYGSGVLHVVLLATSIALVTHGWIYDVVLAAQLALFAAAAAGVPLARYYVTVTWATLVGLWRYLRRGVPTMWEAAEGTR